MFFKFLYYRLLLEEKLRQERGFDGVIHFNEKSKINGLIQSNRKRQQEAKEKIYKAIQKLKEKNEKITIRKVAELANVNKNTANKYVRQAREKGII